MASFVRTLTTASLLPAAVAVTALSHSSLFPSFLFPVKSDLPLHASLLSVSALRSFEAISNPFRANAALHMESMAVDAKPYDEQTGVLPELMVKLAISAAELAEILAHESRTEALIESVRAVAMCSASGSTASMATASDLWSLSSSRKASSENLGFSCSAGKFRRRMWGPASDVED